MIAIVFGLFIAGLAYLQYQQITSIDWIRIEDFSYYCSRRYYIPNISYSRHDSIGNVQFWYSIDRQHVYWNYSRFYEGIIKVG
jgi:hypothetical protein